MLDVDKIPDDILEDIMSNMDDDSGMDLKDRLRHHTPEQAFWKYCTWHGLIGWGPKLSRALDSLRDASVDREDGFEVTALRDTSYNFNLPEGVLRVSIKGGRVYVNANNGQVAIKPESGNSFNVELKRYGSSKVRVFDDHTTND